MKAIQILLFFVISILITSCDFPEYYFTSEPVCNSNTIDDLRQENQLLLITKLKKQTPTDFRYFFKTFKQEGEYTYMITNFRNEESCFDISVLVDNWDKLAGMKRTNGYAYPNELYDLRWEIKTVNGNEVVKYLDMHNIID